MNAGVRTSRQMVCQVNTLRSTTSQYHQVNVHEVDIPLMDTQKEFHNVRHDQMQQ